MKVIFDHQVFEDQRYGGISRYFVELAGELNLQPRCRAAVAASSHLNEYLRASALPGFHHYSTARFRGAARLRAAANRWAAPVLARLLGADIVHATYFRPAARRPGRPLVLTVYDMIHEIFPGTDDLTSGLKRRAVQAADHVICISHHTRSDLIRLLGIAESKTSVTHLSHSLPVIDTDSLLETDKTHRPYLLYVGFRFGYKNFEGFLRSFAASTRLRQEFDIVCFGGGPFSSQELALASALGLSEAQLRHATGGDGALARAYTEAHAFVYPSVYEGFGIPPLEAMARGCAVVCSQSSSIPEVVGAAAALFDPNNRDSMLYALEAVCLDTSRRAQLRRAGLRQQEMFTWRRCAEETVRIYTSLMP
jgi:glycosyltransferase involved in cell wall biosynthesis